MYSEKIEGIIEAILNVGEMDESQLAVLKRVAEKEGEDPDELEIVVKGRLAKMKKAVVGPANLPNAKHGNVMKCPSCGAQVVGGTAVCPECGYTFSNVSANSSIEKLQAKLDDFNRRQEQREDSRGIRSTISHSLGKSLGGTNNIYIHKMDIVKNFPVPNTRADLLDFLTMIQPMVDITGPREGFRNVKGFNEVLSHVEEDLSYAYWLLYTNCINKARLSFSNDSDFSSYFAFYEQEIEKTKGIIGYLKSNPQTRLLVILLIALFVGFGLMTLGTCASSHEHQIRTYQNWN